MEPRVPHRIPGVASSIMDSHVPYDRLQHGLTVYPIDRMQSLHLENDYIDSPSVVSQQPSVNKENARGQEVLLAPHHPSLYHCEVPDATTHPWISFNGRPSSVSSSSSTSSDQRLLDHATPTPVVDTYTTGSGQGMTQSGKQPKVLSTKPHNSKTVDALPLGKKHLVLCEKCGKCRCTECTLPRPLPSCWVCNQECLFSAQNCVDSVTCMCLVKGVFYHCTEDEDEEGSCADKPCSCSNSSCCARWSCLAVASLVLPCLMCYLPATGCTKLSQKCYDSLSRPGCRCKVSEVKSCPLEKRPF